MTFSYTYVHTETPNERLFLMMIIKHFAFHFEISIIYALIISEIRNNNNRHNTSGNVMKKRKSVKWKWI